MVAVPNEEKYLINIENSLVHDELIDINDQNFQKMMFLYNSALKEIKTKIEILQEECEQLKKIIEEQKKVQNQNQNILMKICLKF